MTNSLFSFIDQFYQYTLLAKLFNHSLGLSFVNYGSLKMIIAKVFFYFSPLIGGLALIIISKVENNKYYIIGSFGLFTISLYLLASYPEIDYIHISPLISLTIMELIIIISFFSSHSNINKGLFVIIFLLVISGFIIPIFFRYYRWEMPLIKNRFFLPRKKARIFVDPKYQRTIPEITAYVKGNSRPNDYIFVYYYAPMLNFLLERKDPSYILDMSPGLFSLGYKKDLLKKIRASKPKIVITHASENIDKDILYKYIKENYLLDKTYWEFHMWKLNH